MLVLSFFLALTIVIVHLLSTNFRFLSHVPRSKYLSFFAGISVAFVFVEVLPNLNKHQQNIEMASQFKWISLFQNHAYLVAMIGFSVFYGLQRLLIFYKKGRNSEYVTVRVFWIHIASYFIYNGLIGYILHDEDFGTVKGMLFYFFAVLVHIISNDRGLRDTHKHTYDKIGRKLLSSAVMIGWFAGGIIEISQPALSTVFAFLSGGMIINAMKEELPKENQSSFVTFTIGCILYTALLLASE
ncbi:MAG: hypothetical protein ABF649_07930 [Bacillus sp. (in: firmicutes)]